MKIYFLNLGIYVKKHTNVETLTAISKSTPSKKKIPEYTECDLYL